MRRDRVFLSGVFRRTERERMRDEMTDCLLGIKPLDGTPLGRRLAAERKAKCKCNNPDPLLCHECEEATGVCYCRCHDK
jgi:hypothetical protein